MIFKKIGILFVILIAAKCTYINRMLETDGFSDPFCAIFDQKTGECQACICRGYFDKNRRCQPVDDLCQSWNINTGECTSCYRGYQLINNTCVSIIFYNPSGV